MKKTKVSFFEVSEKWQKDLLTASLPRSQYQLRFTPSKLTRLNARKYADSEVVSIFIHSQIDKKILDDLPRLRFIATNSTGFDHIDLAECKRRGVKVANVPFYGENTVAEHTFALILAITRKIVRSVNRTKHGKFSLKGLRGFDLKGKTIGIVGTGHIGRHVVRIAHGFEMKMLAYDVKKDKALENHYPLKYVSLERLLKNSDIISLHAPYNKHTHHLINKKNLQLVKPGSILINTARGGLVDTKALLVALQKGRLAGAGLDVLEEEGVITEESALISRYIDRRDLQVVLANHRLMSMDNVIVTPHNAFNSNEAIRRIIDTTIANIRSWKRGRSINLVS